MSVSKVTISLVRRWVMCSLLHYDELKSNNYIKETGWTEKPRFLYSKWVVGWKYSKTLLNYRLHRGKKSREKKLKKPLNRAAIKYICSTCLSFLSLKASSCIKLICCRAEIIDLRARTTSSWWMSANEWWPKFVIFNKLSDFHS